MSFTKGEWVLLDSSDGSFDIWTAGEYWLIASRTNRLQRPSESRANGRLLAAAPDLLAACQAFVDAYEKSLQLEKTDVALRLAKIAIEKAVGCEHPNVSSARNEVIESGLYCPDCHEILPEDVDE